MLLPGTMVMSVCIMRRAQKTGALGQEARGGGFGGAWANIYLMCTMCQVQGPSISVTEWLHDMWQGWQ
jgi:hypothetical protein